MKTMLMVPQNEPSLETWAIWREKLDIHLAELKCDEDDEKKNVLLKTVGTAAYSVLHSLCSPQSPRQKTFKDLCSIFIRPSKKTMKRQLNGILA